MKRANPGDERLRALERRARQGDPEAAAALRAMQARRGDARAEADILAQRLREHPTLDHRRAVMAVALGEMLQEYGVEPLIVQHTVRSDQPVRIPGRKNRAKVALTYGFDGAWYMRNTNVAYQGVPFGIRVQAVPRGDVDYDVARTALPAYQPLRRWLGGGNMTDGGVSVQWVENAIYFHERQPEFVDQSFFRGALPGDFFDWPFSASMPRERLQVMLETTRGPAVYRAFLADLYAFDLARFPADLAAMEDQRPFVEARAERARQAERRFTGLR